jgi:transposase
MFFRFTVSTPMDGSVVVRRKLRRSEVIRFFVKLPAALIGMEACATAHYWARELERLGHTSA